jgi:hypothetical protein
MTCVHCHKNRRIIARGLCRSCFRRQDVRDLYPAQGKHSLPEDDDPSEEQLQATITEQGKCLPKWWNDEVAFGPED